MRSCTIEGFTVRTDIVYILQLFVFIICGRLETNGYAIRGDGSPVKMRKDLSTRKYSVSEILAGRDSRGCSTVERV